MKGEKGEMGAHGPPGGDGAKVSFIHLQHYCIPINIISTRVENLYIYFRDSWDLLEKLAKAVRKESRWHA